MSTSELIKQLDSKGGFSTMLSGESPSSGYMVSLANKGKIISRKDFTDVDLLDFILNNSAALEKSYLGAWIENGNVYLDISNNIPSLFPAIIEAVKNKQVAIYDVTNDKSLYLKSLIPSLILDPLFFDLPVGESTL
jgi:hypothetical protein